METIVLEKKYAGWSDDELFDFSNQNKDVLVERDSNFNIIIMSPSGFRTGRKELRVGRFIDEWNEKTGLGYVTGATSGYFLKNGSMRVPDAAWVAKLRIESIDKLEQERFLYLCPDFIVEIMSPSDRLKTAKLKMDEWIENGCRLAFLIHPKCKKFLFTNPIIM